MIIRIKPKMGDELGANLFCAVVCWFLTYYTIREFVSGRMFLLTTGGFTFGLMAFMGLVFALLAVNFVVEFTKCLRVRVTFEDQWSGDDVSNKT